MQRLHLDDLVAHVAEAEEWTKIDIPAIAPHDQDYRLSDHEVHARRRGDLLHPERESKDVLDGLRKRMGSRYFEAQYQQNPVPAGGAIIRPEWFGTYTTTPQLESFEGIVQVWDTASKTSLTHDFSACTTWGMLGDKLYLLDVHRGRYEFPELRRLVIDHAWEWHADRVAIEDAGGGMSLIQDLGQRGDLRVDGFSPRGERSSASTVRRRRSRQGECCFPTRRRG
jgi:phage terminase large subunit-like protein